MRDLTAEQIKTALVKGIEKNTSEAEFEQIGPYVKKFTRAISRDVKEGDEFVIRWLPDGSMISLYEGQPVTTIKSDRFAKVVWSIWFGEHSVVDRDSLVKQLVARSS